MKLFWSPRSPYVRKVLIVAHETGAFDRIDLVPTVVLSAQPSDEMLAVNPLGQIPTLVTASGRAIFDSSAICYYLDVELGRGALHPADTSMRISMLRRQALGDGIATLLLAWMSERARQQPGQSAALIAAINKKLPAVFAVLEADAALFGPNDFDVGHAAIVAALGYCDFRFSAAWQWRPRYPALAAWFAAMRSRPSVAATDHYDELAARKSAYDTERPGETAGKQ